MRLWFDEKAKSILSRLHTHIQCHSSVGPKRLNNSLKAKGPFTMNLFTDHYDSLVLELSIWNIFKLVLYPRFILILWLVGLAIVKAIVKHWRNIISHNVNFESFQPEVTNGLPTERYLPSEISDLEFRANSS